MLAEKLVDRFWSGFQGVLLALFGVLAYVSTLLAGVSAGAETLKVVDYA